MSAIDLALGSLSTVLQLLLIASPLLLLGMAMHWLSGRVQTQLCDLLGLRGYLVIFGWLGVSIHELSHAAGCLIFGHSIVEFNLVNPFARRPEGAEPQQLGGVVHRFDRRNPYHQVGRLFIGIAPVLVGALILALAWYALTPGVDGGLPMDDAPLPSISQAGAGSSGQSVNVTPGLGLSEALTTPFKILWHTLADTWSLQLSRGRALSVASWQFWLLLYLMIAVGSALRLSPQDLRGSLPGLVALLLTTLLVSAIANGFALNTGTALAIFAWGVASLEAVAALSVITLAVITLTMTTVHRAALALRP